MTTTTGNGIASQPLPTIYPSRLALNSWSEIWVTLSTTCPALRVREETLLVFDWQSDNSSSGPDFEASTSIQELCFNTPEMWLRKRQQKPNSSWHLSSSFFKKKKKNERKKERKKKRYLTSPKPSVSFVFLLPLCVYLANLFELIFVSDFI